MPPGSYNVLPAAVEYLIKQYPLESGALEIEYLEEFFGEFPRRKTAAEVLKRLAGRESLILMAESTLPDEPATRIPVAYKVVHELRPAESEPKLRDLVERLRDCIDFDERKVLYSWIGATRRDWRGQGHFRALTEQSEAWAVALGYQEVVVKTKNKFYDMRAVLAQLGFDVVKFERHPSGPGESKVYLSKQLLPDLVAGHRSRRTVVHAPD